MILNEIGSLLIGGGGGGVLCILKQISLAKHIFRFCDIFIYLSEKGGNWANMHS